YGTRNAEGEMILEFAVAMDLVISSTFFVKEESKTLTYESGGCRSAIDFVLIRKREQSTVKDLKEINGEEILPQHKLLICKVVIDESVKRKDDRTIPKTMLWKLKKCDVKEKFRLEVERNVAGKVDEETASVEEIWKCLKDSMTEAANNVCEKTKGKPSRHKETWWWNEGVSEAVDVKRKKFKAFKKSKSEADKVAYNAAKKEAKIVICRAKNDACRNFGEMCEKKHSEGNIFKVVKRIVKENKDVVGCGCIKDNSGGLVSDEGKIRGIWKDYFNQLLNEEFQWDRSGLAEADAVCGPSENISKAEVRAAVAATKVGKAAGPSGVVSELLKASGDNGITWITNLFNKLLADGKIPDDWKRSWMVPVYKGKGDALECSSYRGIKLLEHAMKVFERVVERKLRSSITIDEQQFGFRPGRGTTDAIFIVRQMQEKFLGKKKELWMAFVDLEKAFDRVPREVLWWALRTLGACEWLIKVVQSMYDGVTTSVRVEGNVSEEFEVGVGVHQGSVLSPLLFISLMEALSRNFRRGLPWELLYADDLVILADSEKELLERIKNGKVA